MLARVFYATWDHFENVKTKVVGLLLAIVLLEYQKPSWEPQLQSSWLGFW